MLRRASNRRRGAPQLGDGVQGLLGSGGVGVFGSPQCLRQERRATDLVVGVLQLLEGVRGFVRVAVLARFEGEAFQGEGSRIGVFCGGLQGA